MAITETRSLPAQFIEDIGKDYAKQLTATTSVPVDTSTFAPQVAAQDPLQQRAAQLTASGVGAFQPYLQAAQAATGPQAYEAFMSPYQQQVIDTTLSEFDRQRAIQEKSLRALIMTVTWFPTRTRGCSLSGIRHCLTPRRSAWSRPTQC